MSEEKPGMCCGKVRTSKFCPDCGKELTGDALLQLRQYLQVMAGARNKDVEREKRKAEEEEKPEWKKEYLRIAAKRQKVADKWQRWLDTLDALMAGGSND